MLPIAGMFYKTVSDELVQITAKISDGTYRGVIGGGQAQRHVSYNSNGAALEAPGDNLAYVVEVEVRGIAD